MNNIIYEDKDICIKRTNQQFDFIATIENKSKKDLYIDFTDDTIIVEAQNWIGILADEQGFEQLYRLENGQYYINV